ncbi:MAG: ATP-grasp domain-containing protein [Gammaproteobacteria bacterium]|nr:ATP-grasp domain-containing protein [Gammaproteobacteria bacterium]
MSKAGGVLLVTPPTSYRLPAYLRAAGRLGLGVVVASQGHHPLIQAAFTGIHYDPDEPDWPLRLAAAAAPHGPRMVVATDDGTVEAAARVAPELGLPHNSLRSVQTSRRKDLARQALGRAGLPVPRFRRLHLDSPLAPQLEGLSFPCVVKPLALSGSRGVMRVDDAADMGTACARIQTILRHAASGEERDWVLVEDYLPGREVAFEGLLVDGRLVPLVLFDKPDPLEGPFFEETYYITPSRLPASIQSRLVAHVAAACAAYGLRQGPVHAELRVKGDDSWILELAARTIGGQCARLLSLGTGHSLEELVLRAAMGREVAPVALEGGAGVLMIPIPGHGILRRVEGVSAALRVPCIEELEISVREGYELVPLPEGSSYLGFIFARAPTPAAAEEALRAAHRELKVVVSPVLGRQPVETIS